MVKEGDERAVFRKGKEVVKTTVEIDKDLYKKLKHSAVVNSRTIRDLITEAIRDSVDARSALRRDERDLLQRVFSRNELADFIVATLEISMPKTTAAIVFNEKCMRHGVDARFMTETDISTNLVEDLSLSARFSGGGEAGRDVYLRLVERIRITKG